jgi:hypothetical protein
MEKGKKYLLLKEKKRKKVFEVEVLDVSESCYKLKFIDVNAEFELDILSNIKWLLKEGFSKKFKVLDEIDNTKMCNCDCDCEDGDDYCFNDELQIDKYDKTKIVEEVFDVEKVMKILGNPKGMMNIGITTHSIQRKLLDRIIEIAKFYNIKNILTNTNLSSVIQDVCGFTINSSLSTKEVTNIYPVGNIGEIIIYVDPTMKWNDQRIIFKNDDCRGTGSKEIYIIKVIDKENILI